MSTEIDLKSVERYQKMLAKDPKSKVFAPLADSYRKLGMLKEALEVAQEGIKAHPKLTGGRVALSRILGELGHLEQAIAQAEYAIGLNPENVLAHHLKAEYLLRKKEPKEALKSYKTLLFLVPSDERAQKAVKKLESLTADEYEEEIFTMKPLREIVKGFDQDLDIEDDDERQKQKESYILERIVSLADAYLARQDTDKAIAVLNDGEAEIGAHVEIVKRLEKIHKQNLGTMAFPASSREIIAEKPQRPAEREQKVRTLQRLQKKFAAKRFTSTEPSGS